MKNRRFGGTRFLPKISEEELAQSAKTRREATNRLGVLFHETQMTSFQRILSREGNDEGVTELIEPVLMADPK
jgi:hypothetical protein